MQLGATFDSERVVTHYPAETDVGDSAGIPPETTILSDVSDLTMLLFSGESAPAFAEVAFAGPTLPERACAFEAVLTGDGSIASIPLLARTGMREYVSFDLSPRAEILEGWLSFLSSVDQNGQRPFASLQTDDASGSHVALLLWGTHCERVLSDYLDKSASLPRRGELASCLLDRIPCILLHLDTSSSPAYVLLIPPVHATALWRSLLSFVEVEPVGREALRALLAAEYPWIPSLGSTDALRMSAARLRSLGLVRSGSSFVGSRGLSDTEPRNVGEDS